MEQDNIKQMHTEERDRPGIRVAGTNFPTVKLN